ncbi:hypothetical protein [Hungatella hathewayi]|uniref:hypothetical protein n=1 Tax=Hungatella hathewayi TaxID=154046 RepID=UPI00356495BB
MKNMKTYLLALAVVAMGLTGCSQNAYLNLETSQSSVLDYNYNENSKATICFSSSRDSQIDVTNYVTNYSSGDIFLTAKGLEEVLGLKQIDATEEDKNLLKQFEKDNNYETISDNIIKLQNEDHYFLFRDGSNLYVFDGSLASLSNAIITTESGELSYPLFDIIFKLGYESIGTSVNNDVISYIIYEAVDGYSAPEPTDEEGAEPVSEGVNSKAEEVEPTERSETNEVDMSDQTENHDLEKEEQPEEMVESTEESTGDVVPEIE